MTLFVAILSALLVGIVEGITEWLPVSSTGHLLLLEEVLHMENYVSEAFYSFFLVAVQLGAVMAVVVLYFHKLNPFSPKKSAEEKKGTWRTWLLILVAILPATIIGVPLDDWFEEHLYGFPVIAATLILYGIAFIVLERVRKNKSARITDIGQLTYKTAFFLGVFQVLALIPGTSRSGATIIGGILLGTSRPVAAEFSFFLALPVMLGASLLRGLKFAMEGVAMSGTEIAVLAVGTVVSFLVSLVAIRFLMNFVKKHSFEVFGWYRIVLGILVLIAALIWNKF